MWKIIIEHPDHGRQVYYADRLDFHREIGIKHMGPKAPPIAGDVRITVKAWSGCQTFDTWRPEQ